MLPLEPKKSKRCWVCLNIMDDERVIDYFLSIRDEQPCLTDNMIPRNLTEALFVVPCCIPFSELLC